MKPALLSPSIEQLKYYLDKRETLDNYVVQENALNKLFSTFPNNTDLDDILLKSATLNHFLQHEHLFDLFSCQAYFLAEKCR